MRRTAEAEAVAIELFRTPEGRADPYPRYHRLRELAPVFYSDDAHAWLLTRYDDCYAALRDPRLGKDYVQRMDNARPFWRERRSLVRFERSMLNVDGPYHTRLRRLVSKVFTFRSVEQLRPRIERMVTELLDPLERDGRGNLLDELAFPLPVTVIGEVLGVPADDRAQFRDLVRDLTAVFEVGATMDQFDAADAATEVIDTYFLDLIARRRRDPGDDMLSRLVGLDEDDALTDDELVTLVSLLFAAGFETTTNLVGNGMLGLLKQPDQLSLLRERPDVRASLADEILRYDGTAQMVVRQTKTAFEIDAITIPAGQTVFVMIGAANHDPSRYHDPDRIDLTRSDIRPVSFGGGVHFCLGAALARAEIEIVFSQLVDRFGAIEIDGDEPRYRDRLTLRGLESLPLRVSVQADAGVHVPEPASVPVSAAIRRVARPASGDGGLGLRPSGPADAAWRESFRVRVESGDLAKSPQEIASTIDLLSRVPLFAECSPDDLDRLATTAYALSFDPMDVLCAEGAESSECYVISEGEALVTIGGNIVAHVRADDVVGERGPILGEPRAATVTALTHMVTYAISRAELDVLLERSPATAAAMREDLARRYG